MQSLIESTLLTMSSLEIAELCDKEHKNVMRDIRTMLEELKIDTLNFEHIYKDKHGREQNCFELDKELTITLISGYNVELRNRVIKRWLELEMPEALSAPTLPKLVLEFKAGIELAEILGFRHNQAIISANRAVEKLTGTDVMLLMGSTHLRAPVQAQTYTPTELGKMLEVQIGPRAVNRLLDEAGLQEGYRNHRDDLKWNLLEKGEAFGEYLDVEKVSGGAPVKQIKWYATVIPLIEGEIEAS